MGGSPCGVGVMGRLTDDEVRGWLEDSCARQGVPVVVADREALRKVGVLLGRHASMRSDAPDRLDPVRVEEVPTAQSRSHDGVVQEDLDDGALPAEWEVPPLSRPSASPRPRRSRAFGAPTSAVICL